MKVHIIFASILALTAFPLILAGCASFKPFIPAGDHDLASLEHLLDEAVNEFKLPGIQAGVLRHGGVPIIAASGALDLKHRKQPISNSSVFRIGSTTKMFIAALTCRYAEEGKLRLDDTLVTWFPEYPQAGTITIKSSVVLTTPMTITSYSA